MTTDGLSRAKAIGWSVAFFVCGAVLTFVVAMLLQYAGPGQNPLIVQVVAQIAGFLAATWLIGIRVLKWSWSDLRWREVGVPVRGFGIGLVVGMLPALLALAVAVPAGGAGWSLDGGTAGQWMSAVGGLGVLLLPAAFSEELIFRGVPYVALTRSFGKLPAALVLSVLFGAAHRANPNVTGLAMVNVALAGVFLSAAFWLPGGIWTATGAHLGWNLTLAALGAPVSGLPFELPMLDYRMGGPGWLTGGEFGPEGGVLATVVVGAAAVAVFRRVGKTAT